MLKKIGLAVIAVAIIVSGFFAYWYVGYQASPDKVASDAIGEITRGDVNAFHERLSTTLKTGDQAYWQSSEVFQVLRGYKGSTKLVSKQPAISTDASQPDPYAIGTEALRFVYQMRPGDKTYQLTIDLIRDGAEEPWRIGLITGGYQAS